MFKSITPFRIAGDWHPTLHQAQMAMGKHRFVECGATQASSVGWIEPRGEKHGPLVEAIGDQWLMTLCIQTKLLPAGVVKEEVEKFVEKVRHREGRKPGKKEMKEIKEAVVLELLPKAFTKKENISIWIDRKNKLVVVDTTSQTKCDSTTATLVKTFDGLPIGHIQTEMSPAACMTRWLLDGNPPLNFSVDRECELKANDEQRSAVKYSRSQLDTDDVKQHLNEGKTPTQLAMSWLDRMSFVLTANMSIKKVEFLDVPLLKKRAGKEDDPFDANGAIVTGELSRMIPDLIEALGGELAATSQEREDTEQGSEDQEREAEADIETA